jgi:Family of unknown function (DUF5947)
MSDGAPDGVSASASRLRGLVRRPAEVPQEAAEEQCDLCGESIPARHRHLIDVHDRRLLCACRPCSILFDHRGAGGGHFRLLPDRVRYVEGFRLDDMLWQSFRIPVDLAFFFHSSAADRVVAFYPAPIGATESLLELSAWDELVVGNPVLEELDPDVEALLVNRTRGARDHWLVPIDRCYELVGVIRTRWKGFGGGSEVWEEIDRFFEGLRRQAKVVESDRKEKT